MVNHLLFANNSLIFYKATKLESKMLLSTLHTYALALGQCIYTDKTKKIFSKNVKVEARDEIMAL